MSSVLGPGFFRDVVDVGRVRGAAQVVGHEVLGLPDEVHGEAADRLARLGQLPRGDGGHRGGVETTGQQRAPGHVGNQLAAHDVLQQVPDVGDGRGLVVGVRARLQGPVPGGAQPAAADRDDRPRLDLVHAVPHRVARGLDEREQFPDAVQRDCVLGGRVGQDGLGLGAEQHPVGGLVVVERLDPHAVADHHELVLAGVPDREGVHAVEPFGERVAPFQVGVQHDLGV